MKKMLKDLKAVPRWVIQVTDCLILLFSFSLSYFLIYRFEFSEIARGHFFIHTFSFVAVSALVFSAVGIHTGLIRYSNLKDIFRIFLAVLLSSITFFILKELLIEGRFGIRSSNINFILFINFFIASSLLIFLRIGVKETFLFARRISHKEQERVLIYGVNRDAILVKNALDASKDHTFNIIGFLDPKGGKKNTSIEQKRVFRLSDLSALRYKQGVQKLMLLNEHLGSAQKKAIIEQCLQLGIKLVTVPPSNQWAFGKLSHNQIKSLNIEDLLQRAPIRISNQLITNEMSGKTILVTGAAGSIGSELVSQLLKVQPQQVILCDQAESSLHELQLEMEERFPGADIVVFIGNVQNYKRMECLFRQHTPQIVFHAAAYKHVPMMERHPSEAVLANVVGTKHIAELSLRHHVEKFVMISTDKAVNPTNVMGASKRIAEMYVQSLNNTTEDAFEIISSGALQPQYIKNTKTKFITTRFGNVLGSNGSVLPRFQAQIQKGGPVTVTDPRITRYFMTIPEAVQLVLEAATMGQGGEIYVFDMGTPVKIADLATQMIKLAGLEPGKDIRIEFTGLRPGEKLFEELLNDKETTAPTHHEKIKIAKVIANDYSKVLYDIEDLILLSSHDDDMLIVKKMKEIVPEFLSRNSSFSFLDDTTGQDVRQETSVADQVLVRK